MNSNLDCCRRKKRKMEKEKVRTIKRKKEGWEIETNKHIKTKGDKEKRKKGKETRE
jgi:hypothetical protein